MFNSVKCSSTPPSLCQGCSASDSDNPLQVFQSNYWAGLLKITTCSLSVTQLRVCQPLLTSFINEPFLTTVTCPMGPMDQSRQSQDSAELEKSPAVWQFFTLSYLPSISSIMRCLKAHILCFVHSLTHTIQNHMLLKTLKPLRKLSLRFNVHWLRQTLQVKLKGDHSFHSVLPKQSVYIILYNLYNWICSTFNNATLYKSHIFFVHQCVDKSCHSNVTPAKHLKFWSKWFQSISIAHTQTIVNNLRFTR